MEDTFETVPWLDDAQASDFVANSQPSQCVTLHLRDRINCWDRTIAAINAAAHLREVRMCFMVSGAPLTMTITNRNLTSLTIKTHELADGEEDVFDMVFPEFAPLLVTELPESLVSLSLEHVLLVPGFQFAGANLRELNLWWMMSEDAAKLMGPQVTNVHTEHIDGTWSIIQLADVGIDPEPEKIGSSDTLVGVWKFVENQYTSHRKWLTDRGDLAGIAVDGGDQYPPWEEIQVAPFGPVTRRSREIIFSPAHPEFCSWKLRPKYWVAVLYDVEYWTIAHWP